MGRLTRTPVPAEGPRGDAVAYGTAHELAAFGGDAGDWAGYAGILCTEPCADSHTGAHGGAAPAAWAGTPAVYAPPNLDYLAEGDVVLLLPSGTVNVLYRRASPHNTILATERCNSFCLMCSQPPQDVDDGHRVGEILRLLDLVDPATRELGMSGGEPTLLGDGFFAIVEKAAARLPDTALHVLTNGRRFADATLARRLGAIGHPDLMLGIPLYSDVDERHDYVVQARGAYDETLAGFYHLAKAGVRLELRVVLHRQTVDRLPRLAAFIARNLPFVEHVALMGLEMFGFTPRNLDVLWVDPADYAPQLEAATRALALAGMRVSIYNHQLCTVPRSVWPFAVKSISDWKNVYLDACAGCGARAYCGGFFQSATKRHSAHIRALPTLDGATTARLEELWGVTPGDPDSPAVPDLTDGGRALAGAT